MLITLQSIFDAAWQKFIVEDAPPALQRADTHSGYNCSYCTVDGRKCAVGLVLPDAEKFASIYATYYLDDLIAARPELFDIKEGKTFEFQRKLHDSLCDLSNGGWKFTLEERKQKYLEVAKEWNLKVPESV